MKKCRLENDRLCPEPFDDVQSAAGAIFVVDKEVCRRQTIQVGRVDTVDAVAAEGIPALLVGHDQQNVLWSCHDSSPVRQPASNGWIASNSTAITRPAFPIDTPNANMVAWES